MSAFRGTRRLVRLALRRDRVSLPITITLAVAMVAGSAPALAGTYKSYEEIVSYIASSVPSIVGRVFQGTVQGPDIGSILMAEVFYFGCVILGLMSAFIVTRHTRHNEETGAGELLGSTVIGRSAMLSAALSVAVGANIIAGLVIFAIVASTPDYSAIGSAVMALSLASFGLVMAGVAAITSQLSDYRRGANLMASAVLGVFFIIRALGDALGEVTADGLGVVASWISWLSPMGWSYQALPFSDNRLFPIAMMLGLFFLLCMVAYGLMARRDIGSSIFSAKPGPARAAPTLRSAVGLAKRLQNGNLLAWTIGFVISGGMVAVIMNDFRETFEENEVFAEWLASVGSDVGFVASAIATMLPLLAAMLSGYVVAALSKMNDEESSGRIEYVLGTAVTRIRWLLSHVGYTTVGVVTVLASMGAAGGIGYSIAADNTNEITGGEIFLSALANAPAMLLFMSVILLVFAAFGRLVRAFAWTYYAYCALIGSLAGIFNWPSWISNASPFVHTPLYPATEFDWLPIVVMSLSSIGLVAASAWLFSRRDIVLH